MDVLRVQVLAFGQGSRSGGSESVGRKTAGVHLTDTSQLAMDSPSCRNRASAFGRLDKRDRKMCLFYGANAS
jgi:hypothetical protein